MDLKTLKEFEVEIQKHVPDFSIKFKNQTASQKLIGFLTQSFNSKYMTSYATTSFPTVYFPTKVFYESQPDSSFKILAHEFIHMMDMKNHPTWWKLMYALPQALAIFPLIAFAALSGPHSWIVGILLGSYLLGCVAGLISKILFWIVTVTGVVASLILAVWLTHWIAAALFGVLFFIAPWPSPWRTNREIRGYTMNMAYYQWLQGNVPELAKLSAVSQFVTSNYYFMSWNRVEVYGNLTLAVTAAANGVLAKEEPYSIVRQFLADRNLLKG